MREVRRNNSFVTRSRIIKNKIHIWLINFLTSRIHSSIIKEYSITYNFTLYTDIKYFKRNKAEQVKFLF